MISLQILLKFTKKNGNGGEDLRRDGPRQGRRGELPRVQQVAHERGGDRAAPSPPHGEGSVRPAGHGPERHDREEGVLQAHAQQVPEEADAPHGRRGGRRVRPGDGLEAAAQRNAGGQRRQQDGRSDHRRPAGDLQRVRAVVERSKRDR